MAQTDLSQPVSSPAATSATDEPEEPHGLGWLLSMSGLGATTPAPEPEPVAEVEPEAAPESVVRPLGWFAPAPEDDEDDRSDPEQDQTEAEEEQARTEQVPSTQPEPDRPEEVPAELSPPDQPEADQTQALPGAEQRQALPDADQTQAVPSADEQMAPVPHAIDVRETEIDQNLASPSATAEAATAEAAAELRVETSVVLQLGYDQELPPLNLERTSAGWEPEVQRVDTPAEDEPPALDEDAPGSVDPVAEETAGPSDLAVPVSALPGFIPAAHDPQHAEPVVAEATLAEPDQADVDDSEIVPAEPEPVTTAVDAAQESDTPEGETAEIIDAEIVDTEIVDAEILEAEIVEAEPVHVEVIQAEAVQAEAVQSEAVFADPAGTETVLVESPSVEHDPAEPEAVVVASDVAPSPAEPTAEPEPADAAATAAPAPAGAEDEDDTAATDAEPTAEAATPDDEEEQRSPAEAPYAEATELVVVESYFEQAKPDEAEPDAAEGTPEITTPEDDALDEAATDEDGATDDDEPAATPADDVIAQVSQTEKAQAPATGEDRAQAPAPIRQRHDQRASADRRRADPEQILASYPWMFDPTTLREQVDEPDRLWDLIDRLSDRLEFAERDNVRAGLLSLRAVVSRVLGELDDALADGREALRHAEASGELRTISIATTRLAQVLQWRGEFDEADRLYARADSVELPSRLRAEILELAGRSAFEQGRYLEAVNHFERALDVRRGDDPELVERIELALDTITRRTGGTGWGPYPRTRDELLEVPAAPTPLDDGAGLWGYAAAIEPRYAEVQPFAEGVAWVRRPDSPAWELIGPDGTVLIDETAGYRAVGRFSGGLAWVKRTDPEEPGGWFAVDRENRAVVPGGFDDARPFRNGIAAIRQDGFWGAVDRHGQVIVLPRFPGLATALHVGGAIDGFTDEGLAVVDAGGGRFGVVDRTGELVVAPAHAAVVIHPSAFLVADADGNWGAVDRQGQPLVTPSYQDRLEAAAEVERIRPDPRPVL